MASIIWCDHVRHYVEDSRSVIEDLLIREAAARESQDYDGWGVPGFIYLTVKGTERQRAFNVSMISTYEGAPGDGV